MKSAYQNVSKSKMNAWYFIFSRIWRFPLKISMLVFLFLLTSCLIPKQEDCATILKAKDKALLVEFEQLMEKKTNGKISDQEFVQALSSLKTKETALFQAVRHCSFDNPQEYNYWYRGRLKFPSPIQLRIDEF